MHRNYITLEKELHLKKKVYHQDGITLKTLEVWIKATEKKWEQSSLSYLNQPELLLSDVGEPYLKESHRFYRNWKHK